MTATPSLSIIIPVLNEATNIVAALDALAPLRARGAEVIVVDGGSADDTVALAKPLADRVITSARGRAIQMNAGAAIARGDVLLFLHADTRLPPNADATDPRRPRPIAARLGPLRCDDRRHAPAAAARRGADECALAPDRHRHRRSGDVRHARRIRCSRRISRDRPDGGHRARAPPQAHLAAALPARARDDIGAALGAPRRAAHDPADVAAAARVFLRRVAREPRAALCNA